MKSISVIKQYIYFILFLLKLGSGWLQSQQLVCYGVEGHETDGPPTLHFDDSNSDRSHLEVTLTEELCTKFDFEGEGAECVVDSGDVSCCEDEIQTTCTTPKKFTLFDGNGSIVEGDVTFTCEAHKRRLELVLKNRMDCIFVPPENVTFSEIEERFRFAMSLSGHSCRVKHIDNVRVNGNMTSYFYERSSSSNNIASGLLVTFIACMSCAILSL